MGESDPYVGLIGLFGVIAATSFALGWFSQGLLGVF
jgi:hypothetical protein